MKNQVIKVLNKEHGAKVIAYWKSKGVNTTTYTGHIVGNYYGVVDMCFSYWINQPSNSEEIFLPNNSPKRGDKILVWDSDIDDKEERIFLTFIEDATEPVICVCLADEDEFLNGNKVGIYPWKHWSFIQEETNVLICKTRRMHGVSTVNKLLEETINLIKKEEPKQDWYCPKCQIYVSSESVTFEEIHQLCNTSVIIQEHKKDSTELDFLSNKVPHVPLLKPLVTLDVFKLNKQQTFKEATEKYAGFYRCPATNDEEYCRHDIISAINFGAKCKENIICNSEIIQKIRNSKSDAEARRIIRAI